MFREYHFDVTKCIHPGDMMTFEKNGYVRPMEKGDEWNSLVGMAFCITYIDHRELQILKNSWYPGTAVKSGTLPLVYVVDNLIDQTI